MTENKICIYAICKNEIKFIDKWLNSMSEADYIVVLDTGSTDGTYEKLKEDPRVTRVEQEVISPWRFDVARNKSMELAPEAANILLCTDLDEELEPGWAQIIRDNWKEDTMRGHYKYIWSHTDTGAPGLSFTYDKMHDRNNYQWYYAVHEVLGLKGCNPVERLEIETSDKMVDFGDSIVLHHYPDLTKSRANYLDLLKLRLEENPTECYSMYLLAREYALNSLWDDALNMFEQALNTPSMAQYPLVQLACLGGMGDIQHTLGNITEAIVCYTLQIQNSPSHREAYLKLSKIYIDLKMYDVGLAYLKEAEKKTFQHFDWSEEASAWNEQLDDYFAVAYDNLGQPEEALKHVIKALQINPYDERIKANYLSILSHIK